MKVAYLGPPHTYTEQATRAVFPDDERIPMLSIDAVFAAVLDRQAERGVVPLENVLRGIVQETKDNLARHADRISVVDTEALAINHAIGTLHENATIARVLSKDQALVQCSKYLEEKLPRAALLDTPSTTQAMQLIVDQQWEDAAAIGSPDALKHYGLKIVARDIGNSPNNRTLFAVLACKAPG